MNGIIFDALNVNTKNITMIKKQLLKIYLFFLIIATSISCNTDDSSEADKYAGNYEIISYKSNIPVDLNNDSVISQELRNEINSFKPGDLEIRSNLISFFFPKTWISFQYPSEPKGNVEFSDYGFGTNYTYKNNTFLLENKNYIENSYIDNIESNKNVTINDDLVVIDSNHLKMSISKEYYDFSKEKWIMLDIEIMFEKR